MKKQFLPILFSKDQTSIKDGGAVIFTQELESFTSFEKAEEKAQKLALSDPKAKVVIFEATHIIEPRKIEFATKRFNESGELLV